MADKLTFALGPWEGRRNYIQGVKWDGKRFLVAQSRKDTAGESVVLREHGPDLKYTGKSQVLAQAGHGSSFGVATVDGQTAIVIGHLLKGAGYYVGDKFTPMPGVPNGDIATDPDADLLCVRVKTRYRGYSLSSCLAGKPVLLFDATIVDWFNRFQGHAITRLKSGEVCVLVHRDVATLKQSRLVAFTVDGGKLTRHSSYDTTGWGDEAEGALIYDGYVWSTSRIGGDNAKRTVVATRLDLEVDPNPKDHQEDVVAKTKYGWTASKDPVQAWGGNATIDCYGTKFHVRRDLYQSTGDRILADGWRYLIFSFNRRVERVSEYAKGDDWSYYFKLNANDPNSYSEHAGGCAIDINATQHPNGASSKYVGFTKPQVAEIDRILDEMEGIMEWGGNWHSTIDPMHFNWAPGTNTTLGKKKVERVVEKLRKIMQADPSNYGLAEVVRQKISLSVVQVAFNAGPGTATHEVKLVQTALGFTGDDVDGRPGPATREKMARYQVQIADDPKPTPWPLPGYHPDADGIPGRQSLTALGFEVIA